MFAQVVRLSCAYVLKNLLSNLTPINISSRLVSINTSFYSAATAEKLITSAVSKIIPHQADSREEAEAKSSTSPVDSASY